eukprot:747191-Hanusia_phi.AAC.2
MAHERHSLTDHLHRAGVDTVSVCFGAEASPVGLDPLLQVLGQKVYKGLPHLVVARTHDWDEEETLEILIQRLTSARDAVCDRRLVCTA